MPDAAPAPAPSAAPTTVHAPHLRGLSTHAQPLIVAVNSATVARAVIDLTKFDFMNSSSHPSACPSVRVPGTPQITTDAQRWPECTYDLTPNDPTPIDGEI